MASRLEEVAHAFADRLRRLEERVEELERKKSAPTDGEEMERKVTELEVAVDSVLAGRTTLEDKPERAVRLVDALRNGAEPARLPDYRRFVAAMADEHLVVILVAWPSLMAPMLHNHQTPYSDHLL